MFSYQSINQSINQSTISQLICLPISQSTTIYISPNQSLYRSIYVDCLTDYFSSINQSTHQSMISQLIYLPISQITIISIYLHISQSTIILIYLYISQSTIISIYLHTSQPTIIPIYLPIVFSECLLLSIGLQQMFFKLPELKLMTTGSLGLSLVSLTSSMRLLGAH